MAAFTKHPARLKKRRSELQWAAMQMILFPEKYGGPPFKRAWFVTACRGVPSRFYHTTAFCPSVLRAWRKSRLINLQTNMGIPYEAKLGDPLTGRTLHIEYRRKYLYYSRRFDPCSFCAKPTEKNPEPWKRWEIDALEGKSRQHSKKARR